jgi:hypothetical protein
MKQKICWYLMLLSAIVLLQTRALAQNNTPLYITPQGMVGIGTTSPGQLLDVNGAVTFGGGSAGKITISTDRLNGGISNTAGSMLFYTKSPGAFIFNTSSTELLRINTGNGNVGIGTTNPTEKLEVSGRIKDQTGYVVPVGGIIMYSGVYADNFDGTGLGKPGTKVQGWAICNGYNGTPDLIGRFITGAGPGSGYGPNTGVKGGSDALTLTTEQMPAHSHSYGFGGGNAGTIPLQGARDGYTGYPTTFMVSTASAGSSQPFDNRPAYYALFYIMKL